jgi:hypothetical protein
MLHGHFKLSPTSFGVIPSFVLRTELYVRRNDNSDVLNRRRFPSELPFSFRPGLNSWGASELLGFSAFVLWLLVAGYSALVRGGVGIRFTLFL